MKLVSGSARLFATVASPAVRAFRAHPLLAAGVDYLEFLSGKGAGSGWDHVNEVRTVASFVDAYDPVIFDVGANNGQWSLSLSNFLTGTPHFHLFECAPYCFPALEDRMRSIPHALLAKKAVSATTGKTTLHLPTTGSGLASLHERHDVGVRQHRYTAMEVDTVALDDYAAGQHLETIDLLKMDIEGHELFALRGASRLLAQGAVKAVFFEFGSANVNSRTYFRDFWELLNAHHFTLHRLLPGGGSIRVKRYAESLEYFRGATNYIAALG